MAASVVCTYVFSSLFGKGTIGFKEILVGVISGGVTIAVSASLLTNIGACIAIGSFSGFLSSLWLCYVDPIINKNQINDNVGLAAILMNAIFGGLVFSPVFLSSRQTITLADVTIPQIVDSNVPIYQLVYITISAGTGIAFGILSGIFNLIGRNPESDFSNSKFFDYDYGLYNDKEPEESVKPLPSNSLSNQTPNNGTPGT